MTPRERAEAEARGLFRVSTEGGVTWVEEPFGGLRFQGNDEDAEAHVQLYGEPIADAIERAILAALAARDAGEAERTAQAVEAERKRLLDAMADKRAERVRERRVKSERSEAFEEGWRAAELFIVRATSPAPAPSDARSETSGNGATFSARRALQERMGADWDSLAAVRLVACHLLAACTAMRNRSDQASEALATPRKDGDT